MASQIPLTTSILAEDLLLLSPIFAVIHQLVVKMGAPRNHEPNGSDEQTCRCPDNQGLSPGERAGILLEAGLLFWDTCFGLDHGTALVKGNHYDWGLERVRRHLEAEFAKQKHSLNIASPLRSLAKGRGMKQATMALTIIALPSRTGPGQNKSNGQLANRPNREDSLPIERINDAGGGDIKGQKCSYDADIT